MSDIVFNLKKLSDEHEQHLRDIRQKIAEIELYPQAKNLVGKCFKCPIGYSNYGSFGAPVKIRTTGYIYKRILGYIKDCVIVDTFEVHRVGKIEITFHEKEYVSHFSSKSFILITEKQYFNAFNKMIKYAFETGKKEN